MWSTLELAPARVEVEERPDGSTVLRSPAPLMPHARCVTDWLMRWSAEQPDTVFLSERTPEGTIRLTYDATARLVMAAAGALADHGASARRPLVLLSGNSIDHAILSLAAQHVGIPAVPVSPAYSLLSRDHAKLRGIMALVRPAVVYVDDAQRYAGALAALDLEGATLVCSRHAPEGAVDLQSFLTGTIDDTVHADNDDVGPDTVAKILFTSGSTGEPKGVINTQRMLTSNQQMIAQCWPFLERRRPVLVDWLPWNHTFGGNHNFNLVLRHGGTLHINHGKPVPELVGETVENLRAVSPTLYFDVPRGYALLLPFLEQDADLAERFFRRLDLVFYAGAALPQDLWDRMVTLSTKVRGEPIPMMSSWGATETAPMATTVHYPVERAGNIGLPAPGCQIKLVKNGDKLEMRVRGPNVTPGYFGRDDLTAEAFDEEGFYRTGDAGRFEDPAVFDGRVAESFKLTSGTWVHAGMLRVALVAACSPVAQDVVITGHDRDEIGVLLFPHPIEWDRADDPVAVVRQGLAAHNRTAGGSSQRVARALVLDTPPSIDAGEITDKGYVNQRRVLERRAADVERLYAGGDGVLVL